MVAPLLDQLHDRQRCYHLAERDDDMAIARSDVSKVMTDLMQLPLNATQGELLTDVLIQLATQAQADLRQALAERVAVLEDMPLRMVLHLANDEIDVARPILQKSMALEEMDLIYIIKSHSAEYWQEIAKRETLTDKLIDTLADSGDVGTAINLAENQAITLTEYALDIFTPLAGENEALARPLIAREELPKELVAKIYETVGAELKKTIEARFADISTDAGAVVDVLDDVTKEFKNSARFDFMPTESSLAAAAHMKENDMLDPGMMTEVLRRGQIPNFIAQFSAYTGVSPRVAHEMLGQKAGQSLAIACKAVGIDKSAFVGYFLMTHRVRSAHQPIINNHDLAMAIRTYDAIKKIDAVNLLKQSQTK